MHKTILFVWSSKRIQQSSLEKMLKGTGIHHVELQCNSKLELNINEPILEKSFIFIRQTE